MVEERDRIDKIEYDPTEGSHDHFLAIPRFQEIQLSLSKREEELKTSKQLESKQKKERKGDPERCHNLLVYFILLNFSLFCFI